MLCHAILYQHKPYHVENKLYLIRFDKCILKVLLLYIFFILSFILVNRLQALHVNAGCFKCISGINLPPASKSYCIHCIFLRENVSYGYIS